MERLRTIGYRLARITAALLLAVPVSLTMASTAAAATCTPTGFFRDGINLTAAQIGGSVSGALDASGCDIGVYFATPGSVTAGAQILGARYFGVVNNGTTVTVEGASIHDIGNSPFDGTQHGVGIYFTNGGTGMIDGNTVSAYQKGGIVVNGVNSVSGAATTAAVTNNTVSGLGPVDFIAQNGIQVSRGAVAEVRGNAISGNFYTGEVGVGPNPGGQNPEGWEFFSTGLLLFEAGAGTKTSDNQLSGNQHNFANVP
jgi:parallel beta helix pectate lyase-like protein